MVPWQIFVIFVTLLEPISSISSESDVSLEYPLTKSIGYPIEGKLGKDLEDARLSQELMEKFQEMEKDSQESFDNFERRGDKRRRRIVEDGGLDVIEEASIQNRRRSSDQMSSPVVQRRVRSQAHRLQILNHQGLRSHLLHSKISLDHD